MTKDELLALADKVEALEGPSRGVDCWIENHLGLARFDYTPIPWGIGTSERVEPKPFTASLDAAMTLVPEGWLLATLNERNASGRHNWRWKAELWDSAAPRPIGEDAPHVRGLARNAHDAKCASAIALTAASLRALAQKEQQP